MFNKSYWTFPKQAIVFLALSSTHFFSSPVHAESKIGYIDGNTFSSKEVTYESVNGYAIFEGDIILGTQAKMDAISSGTITNGVGVSGNQFRWAGGVIPFEFEAGLGNDVRNLINGAITHWEANTGIDFVLRTAENRNNFPDFVVVRNSTRCASFVGRQGGEQTVWLGANCGLAAAIHELGHTVGLWHEQSREDRDAFVQINWANITGGMEHNFNQHITDGDDIGAYDYASIMHYGPTAFSSNGRPTIVPISPVTATIGGATGLSGGDIAAVAAMYPAPIVRTGPSGADCTWQFSHSSSGTNYYTAHFTPVGPCQNTAKLITSYVTSYGRGGSTTEYR